MLMPLLAALAPLAAPYAWYPAIPVPKTILEVPFAGDVEEGMVLESAAGLAARAALAGRSRTLVWERTGNDGYERWYAGYCRDHRPERIAVPLDELVARLRDLRIVRGYALYRADTTTRPLHEAGPMDVSANVATSLAGKLAAIVVSERLEARFRALGLPCLFDARGLTEEKCLARYGRVLSRRGMGLADPKTRNARSLMIALDMAVVSGQGAAYEQALARCEPDTPVLGWGCGTEDGITIPSSRWGLFQTATNWCHNLTVLASEAIAGSGLVSRRPPARRVPNPPSDARHYVCLTITDGDNIQWLMGNFVGGTEGRYYYANPRRGAVPFTWGLPVPGLALLSPRTLGEVLETATRRDDFVMYSGGGYFYPDLYGAARPEARALELHAERLRGYCDRTGIRILAFNFQDWDSEAAQHACRVFAQHIPGLLGILAFQYYPYSAGEGRILWVDGPNGDRVPVVSCRYTVWAETGRPRDSTPAAIAAELNQLPVEEGGTFSWVLVHAWSYFRHSPGSNDPKAEEPGPSPDVADPALQRGYDPALWTVERLAPHVVPVGAEELLLRIRARGE